LRRPTPTNPAFDLDLPASYRRWRDRKLALFPERLEQLAVEVSNPAAPSRGELSHIRECCRRANLALVVCPSHKVTASRVILDFGRALGLARADGNLCADEEAVSAIRVTDQGRPNEYIPYSNRPLSWHTDGYYNAVDRQIGAWTLFCVRNAAEGGCNELLDPDLLYIQMRDNRPDWVRALMAPDAMTIPPNYEGDRQVRPARSGPVFSVTDDGHLHMRYSARKRNIRWNPDTVTQGAIGFIEHLFSAGSPYIFRHRLEPGQGFVTNNVLHNRSGFRDAAEAARQRLLYRVRYFDRVAQHGLPAEEM